MFPTSPWIPSHPIITCCPNCRSTKRYLDVVRSFDVTKNPRYAVRDTTGDGVPDTFCNVFATDVAFALGCQLPHWWLGKELSANALYDWLLKQGPRYGWERVTAHVAQAAVQEGIFTVAAWQNPKGPGHIAVVLPIPTDNENDPYIAQAGRVNFVGKRLSHGFGQHRPDFFVCR